MFASKEGTSSEALVLAPRQAASEKTVLQWMKGLGLSSIFYILTNNHQLKVIEFYFILKRLPQVVIPFFPPQKSFSSLLFSDILGFSIIPSKNWTFQSLKADLKLFLSRLMCSEVQSLTLMNMLTAHYKKLAVRQYF